MRLPFGEQAISVKWFVIVKKSQDEPTKSPTSVSTMNTMHMARYRVRYIFTEAPAASHLCHAGQLIQNLDQVLSHQLWGSIHFNDQQCHVVVVQGSAGMGSDGFYDVGF